MYIYARLPFPLVSSSLTVAQNEDVVEQFLKENPSAGKLLYIWNLSFFEKGLEMI